MADSAVAITAGSGTSIDTRTESTNGQHRQVMVLGDADTNTAIAPVTLAEGLAVHLKAPTSGGYSIAHLVSAGSTNATVVKASAGHLYHVSIHNAATTTRFLKFHNSATTPTAGASVVYTCGVQAGLTEQWTFPHGVAFGAGIAFTTVTGIGDSNTTAVTASDMVIDVSYK